MRQRITALLVPFLLIAGFIGACGNPAPPPPTHYVSVLNFLNTPYNAGFTAAIKLERFPQTDGTVHYKPQALIYPQRSGIPMQVAVQACELFAGQQQPTCNERSMRSHFALTTSTDYRSQFVDGWWVPAGPNQRFFARAYVAYAGGLYSGTTVTLNFNNP